MAKKNNMYLQMDNLLDSHTRWLMIVGARGVGKTINSLAWAIKKAFDSDQQFIYVRRYEVEIKKLRIDTKLISNLTGLDVYLDKVKDDSSNSATTMIVAKNKNDVVKPVAFFVPLSTYSKYKSLDFSTVFLVIYDEFIDPTGRELPNEVDKFLEFLKTVFRDDYKTKVVFLANATDAFNCYFVYWNVVPTNKITNLKDEQIKIIMYQTPDNFIKEKEKSPINRWILHGDEDDPNITNKFQIEGDFIKKQSSSAKCLYTVQLKGRDFGIWRSNKYLTISKKTDPAATKISIDDLSEEYEYRPYYLIGLSDSLKGKRLTFSDLVTRGIWFKAFKEKRLI